MSAPWRACQHNFVQACLQSRERVLIIEEEEVLIRPIHEAFKDDCVGATRKSC